MQVVLTVYIIIGTKLEENKLVREFGDSYVEYQHEVPMLVPFVKMRNGRLSFMSPYKSMTVAEAFKK